ncbi:MAG: tetratricopeptide repeat protein, partial [Bacteroidetes bacterium]|nr:tetratricopeptide repeat protein [Bacteroidota bacterium]
GEGAWIVPVFLLVFVIATALFFVSGRLRIPILPAMFVAAAGGVMATLQTWRPKADNIRRMRLPLAVGAVLGALVLVLQPQVQQDFAQEYLKLGQLAFERGDFPEAEMQFRASLGEKRTIDGWTNLGNVLAAQGQPQEATEMYRTALAQDSTAALTWFNYGNLFMQTGKPQYAFGAWKKALEYQPRLAAAHRNLGLLLFQAGRLEEALQHLQTYLTLERDTKKRDEVSRDIMRIRAILEQER